MQVVRKVCVTHMGNARGWAWMGGTEFFFCFSASHVQDGGSGQDKDSNREQDRQDGAAATIGEQRG